MTTVEPEWDDDEQAWAMALAYYRAQLAPCGHYLPHATAAEAEERYAVPEPLRCHACTAIAIATQTYKDNPHPTALLFHAVRR